MWFTMYLKSDQHYMIYSHVRVDNDFYKNSVSNHKYAKFVLNQILFGFWLI